MMVPTGTWAWPSSGKVSIPGSLKTTAVWELAPLPSPPTPPPQAGTRIATAASIHPLIIGAIYDGGNPQVSQVRSILRPVGDEAILGKNLHHIPPRRDSEKGGNHDPKALEQR